MTNQALGAAQTLAEVDGVVRREVAQAGGGLHQARTNALDLSATRARSKRPGAGIPEHHGPNAVPAIDCPPGEERGQLRCRHGLQLALAAEEHAGSLVDDQKDGSVAFLTVSPHVRTTQARGGTPVHLAHVVAGRVGTELVEIHAAAAEFRTAATGKQTSGGSPRCEVDVPRSCAEAHQRIEVTGERGSWSGHRRPPR